MRRWDRWSLHRRILVVSAAAVTVAVVMGVAAFALTLDRILYSAAQDTAQAQLAQVVKLVETGAMPVTRVVVDIPSKGALLQVLDAGREVVAASDPAAADGPLTTLQPSVGRTAAEQVLLPGASDPESYAVVARGVRDPSGTPYLVVVAAPLDVEASTVRAATLLLTGGAGLLLLLLLLLVSRMVRRALDPVERIRSEVARITRAGGGGRVTVPPTHDEVARLARTMNGMLDRLDRADASTRQFVSDASHEMRSPLATIRAALEVAATGAGSDPAALDALMGSEVTRMQHLVDDLLTLAKADDGLPLARVDVDLDDLVIAEVGRLRATRAVRVEARVAAARVVGDTDRLRQVLRNLVDNAARHAVSEVALGVGPGVGPTAGTAVLTVDNDGPPVPAADRETVFGRFTRLAASRERDTGGSGLGLAIVRTLVEAHGGTVVATQTPDGRCRFEVRLPLADGGPGSAPNDGGDQPVAHPPDGLE